MKQRKLGRNGPQVSAIGLGCMGFSEFYTSSAASEAEAIGVIHSALSLGLTFLDTADIYGPFTNEVLVGKAIAGRRDQVFLATKFGIQRDPANPKRRGISGKADYVRACCEASLKRLNVERIDLYYQHRVDRSTPIEETVGAMAELVKAGKIRCIGLSEPSVETIRKAHQVHAIAAVQSEYSLWSRDPEDGVLQACGELGIGFVPYSPLGRGFLTGRFRSIEDLEANDYRRHSPRFQGENFAKNLRTRRSRRSPRKNAARLRNSLLRGCWRRTRTSCPFPVRPMQPGSRKTLPPRTSFSAPAIWRASPPLRRAGLPPASATMKSECVSSTDEVVE